MRKREQKPKRARTVADEKRLKHLERLQTASAFPLAFGAAGEFRIGDHGLTKRELFALLLATGLRTSGLPPFGLNSADLARQALEDAEALLEELSK